MTESYVYVVTRNKRRVEEKNYSNLKDAEDRASSLRSALKEWDPKDVKKLSLIHI